MNMFNFYDEVLAERALVESCVTIEAVVPSEKPGEDTMSTAMKAVVGVCIVAVLLVVGKIAMKASTGGMVG